MAQIFGESSISTSNIVDGAPAALDTLNELAAALNDDANFAATVTTALSLKAPLASPTFSGTVTADTIAASSAGATASLLNNITNGTINLGANVTSGTINVGTAENGSGLKTINIGTGSLSGTTTNISIGSNVSGAATSISFPTGGTIKLNGTAIHSGGIGISGSLFPDNQSGSIFVGGNLTTGSLNLANGTLVSNATVNIMGGAISSGVKNINIGTGGTGTSVANVNIGSVNSSVNLAASSTGTVYLPSTILGPGASTSVNIFQTTGAGTISFGFGLTSGGISIANGTSFAGTVSIAGGATTSGTKTINLGTGGGSGSNTAITIGSTGGTVTTTLQGTSVNVNAPMYVSTLLSTSTAAANVYNNVNSAGTLDAFAAAGTIHIGRSVSTGTMNLLTNATSTGAKIVNIGTAGLSGSTTDIAIGTSVATSNVSIHADNLSISSLRNTSMSANIANAPTASGNTKVVNLGTGGVSGSITSVSIGSTAGTSSVTLNGNVLIASAAVPSTATSTGTAGQIAWDANYFYVCTAANTWVRTALATW